MSAEGRASDYTPTTEDVRQQWTFFGYDGNWDETELPQFDRWLAAHDAEVAAQSAAEVQRAHMDADRLRDELREVEAERDALAAVVDSVRAEVVFSGISECSEHPDGDVIKCGRKSSMGRIAGSVVGKSPADVLTAHDREVGARALEEAAADWRVAVDCSVPMSRTTDQWLSARAAALREGREDA